jgi:hypothetical protein
LPWIDADVEDAADDPAGAAFLAAAFGFFFSLVLRI